MSDTLFLIPCAWFVHAIIAGVVVAPITFFARKRVHWQVWELLAFILPYAIFAILMLSQIEPKNPVNMFDSIGISLAIVLAALIRVIVGHKAGEQLCAVLLMCLLCIAATVIYFMTSVAHDSM